MATAIESVIERQDWLQPVETGLQKVADVALDRPGTIAQKVRNFLHGTWLGHPLHPAITDLPIGAWTAASILDVREILTGDEGLNPGTDAVIGVGLAGAGFAAVAGLNDWQYTDGTARRVGVLHGLLNTTATSLFLTSWLLRRNGSRPLGQALSFLGLGVAMFSAYLGGELVYDEKVGVDHVPRASLPQHFTPVLAENDLPENQLRRVEANGVPVLLVRRGDKIHALAETCAHMGGPLAQGTLEGDSVRCPWHGSRYSLETGEVLEGPSAFPQPCLETRIRDGQIEVRVRPSQRLQSSA